MRVATSAMVLLAVLSGALRVSAEMVPDNVCVGQTKHYWVTPNPVPGSTYVWTINGVVQPSITNELYVTWSAPYTPAGSPYTITVQETSALGCPGPIRTGQVFLFDALPLAVNITASQNPVCQGVAVTFTSNVTNGGNNLTYKWFVNAGVPVATTATYTYTPTNGDAVTCEVTSNAPCATNNPAMAAAVVMVVEPAPTVSFTPCFELTTTVEGRPFRLAGALPLGGTYSGGPAVNNPTAGMFNPQAVPAGPVTVTYTYVSAAGCPGSAQTTIQVSPAPASFTCGSPWTDIRDGKVYPTLLIDGRCWMGSNLNYGTKVPYTQVQSQNCVSEKYCYNNNAANCDGIGAQGLQDGPGGLYQWDEMMKYESLQGAQDICPAGWHVPAEAEWSALFTFYGGQAFAGKPMQDLLLPGFHALPTGVVYQNEIWSFKDLATIFWTSTPIPPVKAYSHGMNKVDESVSDYQSVRVHAFPVRCVKN